jgi:uncharacterized protein
LEVDFILGDHEVAIEIKATDRVQTKQIKALSSILYEYKFDKKIIVSTDRLPRLLEHGIMALPWNLCLDKLWAGEII